MVQDRLNSAGHRPPTDSDGDSHGGSHGDSEVARESRHLLADLWAIEEIKRLKARYCRFVDTKRWDDLADLFVAAASIELPEVRQDPFSYEEWLGLLTSGWSELVSVHHAHLPEIVITGDGSAEGLWAMNDAVFHPPHDPAAPGGVDRRSGFGYYAETYAYEESWRIETMRLTRLRTSWSGSS